MSIKTYKPNDTARIEAMLVTLDELGFAYGWADSDMRNNSGTPEVHTLEGWVAMPYGSYLIKGTNNEFYPCDPDVFENRWVEVK